MLSFVIYMILDRIIYIKKSVFLKYYMTLITCVFFCSMFVWWRHTVVATNISISEGYICWGAVFVGLKLLYVFISCIQIRQGYTPYIRHDPFTNWHDWYNWLGVVAYRGVPFLFEIRVLLDWTFAKTALKLVDWWTLEDLHQQLWERFYWISHQEWTNPRRGMNYPWYVKLYQGVAGFVLIIFAIFSPLLYYSTFNPSIAPNSVTAMSISFSFGRYSRFFEADLYATDLADNGVL